MPTDDEKSKRAAATQRWRSNHPDRVRQHRQTWHENHWRDQYEKLYVQRLEWNQDYRARKLHATCDHVACIEGIDRRTVWGRDEGHCRIKLVCDGIFVPFEEMHLDHVVPLSVGGLHCYYNVQTGCGPCNVSKGSRVLSVT